MRHLAALLAGSGFDVFTFDYFGTGDSAGEFAEADLQDWSSDIEVAMRELRDISSQTRVSIIGLRLGATLAATIFSKPRKDVEALVLWDPIVSGARYVEYLHEVSRPHRRRPAEAGGGFEVQGFPLTEAMENAMRALDLALMVPALPAQTLVIRSEPGTPKGEFERALQSHPAGPLSIRCIPALPAWQEEGFGPGAVPVPLLKSIVEWLG
jgi:pimeloyl-ACP methyl ester carboxylesterase